MFKGHDVTSSYKSIQNRKSVHQIQSVWCFGLVHQLAVLQPMHRVETAKLTVHANNAVTGHPFFFNMR